MSFQIRAALGEDTSMFTLLATAFMSEVVYRFCFTDWSTNAKHRRTKFHLGLNSKHTFGCGQVGWMGVFGISDHNILSCWVYLETPM